MSLRMFASVTAVVCGLSLAVAAQAPPTPPAAPPGPAKLRPDKPAPGIPPPAPRPGKDINIRIDATVIESRGDHVVDKKVISVTCVDGKGAFVRSTQSVAFKAKGSEGFNYQDAPLNMDTDVNLRDTDECSRGSRWITGECPPRRIHLIRSTGVSVKASR